MQARQADRGCCLGWSSDCATGNKVIDHQHRQIIDLIDRLIAIEASEENEELIGDTLNQLMRYTQEHLTYEEKLMQAHNYPGLNEHKAAHREFRKRVARFCDEARSSKPDVLREILTYLIEWWVYHITEEDKKIAGYPGGLS